MKHILYFISGVIAIKLFLRFFNWWEPKFTSKDPEDGGNRTDTAYGLFGLFSFSDGIFIMYHLFKFLKFLLLLAHH